MPQPLVLYVDDHDDARSFFEAMCRLRGYAVHCAESVAEAAHLWNVNEYDLVVTDVSMPGDTGFILSRWIRDRNANIPIFLYTGVGDSIEMEDCGATNCFFKGHFEPLFDAMRDALKAS